MEPDYSQVLSSLSPISNSGIDVDDLLSSDDPQGMLAAHRAGVPYVPKGQQGVGPTSMMAQAVSETPATNAPNPPTEKTGPQAVPASITPSGGGQPKFSDLRRQTIQGMLDNTNAAAKTVQDMQSQPGVSDTLAPIQAQRTAAAAATPNPKDPQYRPSVGKRILRGVGAGLQGLAQGGIFGSLLGAVNPEAVGAAPYGAPTGKFSQRAIANQQQLASLDQQLKQSQDAEKADSERLKDTGKSALDVAKGFGEANKGISGEETAETRKATMQANAAKNGQKVIFDDQGNVSDIKDDPESSAYKARENLGHYRTAMQGIAQMKADMEKQKLTPGTPAWNQKQQEINAASERANAYWGNYLLHSKGTDIQGNDLSGQTRVTDDSGAEHGVGTAFQTNVNKQQGNVAQFNDVYGALDNIEGTAEKLVKKGGKLNSPAVAAAIADPKSTAAQWAQGEFATSGLTPEERDYVTSQKAFRENLMALRKSAGGGVSDAQVNRLLEMAPGASTPDLDYLKRQTKQIRGTADRLSEGIPNVKGGHQVRHGAETSPAQSSGKGVSLAAARALPQNKGKSDADIRKDIERHGHKVVD